MKTPSLLLLLLCLIDNIMDIDGATVEVFGTQNPWAKVLNRPQNTAVLTNAGKNIPVLHHAVQHEGDVFAFMARIYDTQQFNFQIWRPLTGGNYQLIYSLQVTPSVTKQHEVFYLLGDQCVHVLPGDRLGLFFTTTVAPVYYGVVLSYFNDRLKINPNEPPSINDTSTFESTLPAEFVAAGFVHINSNTAGSHTVSCPKGLEIPQGGVTEVPTTTTTYLPPTGVPGMTGATGERGDTGFTGATGMKGDIGANGSDGAIGITGPIGPTGYIGANNSFKGELGSVGENGSRGEDGAIGPRGLQGDEGEQGPQGLAGDNYTVILYGPYRYSTDDDDGMSGDRWWASSMAMTVVYIWAAAASVVLLLTFVIILVICCQCCAVQRALKKHSDI